MLDESFIYIQLNIFAHMMLKKRSTDFSPKKKILRRVVEGLFLSNAGPKRGCWQYLTEIREIHHTSDVSFPIVSYNCYQI